MSDCEIYLRRYFIELEKKILLRNVVLCAAKPYRDVEEIERNQRFNYKESIRAGNA
jgi:hypothetical protein